MTAPAVEGTASGTVYVVKVRDKSGYLVVDKYGVMDVNPNMRRATLFMARTRAAKFTWPGDKILKVHLVVAPEDEEGDAR